MTPEVNSKIAILRAKSAEGTLTLEDMREAVKLMRSGRVLAAEAAAKSKKSGGSKKGPAKSADQMLDELAGL